MVWIERTVVRFYRINHQITVIYHLTKFGMFYDCAQKDNRLCSWEALFSSQKMQFPDYRFADFAHFITARCVDTRCIRLVRPASMGKVLLCESH